LISSSFLRFSSFFSSFSLFLLKNEKIEPVFFPGTLVALLLSPILLILLLLSLLLLILLLILLLLLGEEEEEEEEGE
jgi:hypothetical protein